MNSTPHLIDALGEQIAAAPVAELPNIIGSLAALDAKARVRIAQTPAPPQESPDDWLTADEAAAFLKQGTRWVRDHRKELGASELPGRGDLRFSRRSLQRWLRKRVKA